VLDIFSMIPKEVNKSFVESIYYSLAEYKEDKKKTVTNNGTPHRARDYINTGLSEIAELHGFTWDLRKVGFFEYIFLHHTSTNTVYLFISENSIAKLRRELSDRKRHQKKDHYLEGWAFSNDSWSSESVRYQSGATVMNFEDADISYVSEKYATLRDLNTELTLNKTVELCVFVTFRTKKYELVEVRAVIPSSTLDAEYLFTENWNEWIPVSYENSENDDNVLVDEDDFELELQSGILDDDYDYDLDIDDDSWSESES